MGEGTEVDGTGGVAAAVAACGLDSKLAMELDVGSCPLYPLLDDRGGRVVPSDRAEGVPGVVAAAAALAALAADTAAAAAAAMSSEGVLRAPENGDTSSMPTASSGVGSEGAPERGPRRPSTAGGGRVASAGVGAAASPDSCCRPPTAETKGP